MRPWCSAARPRRAIEPARLIRRKAARGGTRIAAVAPLLALILVLGFAPGILTKYINPAVTQSTSLSVTQHPSTATQAQGSQP